VLTALLAEDPRPAYQEDPERIYGLLYAGYEVRFSVDGKTLTLRSLSDSRDGGDVQPGRQTGCAGK